MGMIEYHVELPAANTIVLFHGGSGGNFLASMIMEHIYGLRYNNDKPTNIERNEYFNNGGRLVLERHLNLFFRMDPDDKFGDEKFSLRRYREVLNTYKYTKFIVILSEEYTWLTVLLGDAKSNTAPNFKLFEKKMDYVNPSRLWWYKDFSRVNRHYNFFLRQLQRHGIQVCSVTYKELFLDINKDTIKKIIEFCISLSDKYTEETLFNEVSRYKQKNENLLIDYLKLSDDWSIDRV